MGIDQSKIGIHRFWRLLFLLCLLLLTNGCNNKNNFTSTAPADTYFSLAVTENSHNHSGAKLLFLDFQGVTPDSTVIQNNIVISPQRPQGSIHLDGDAADWDTALFTTVNGLVQNNYPLSEFIDAVETEIKVGSVWDQEYIYFLVQWQDAGHSRSTRHKKWIYAEITWNALAHIGATVGAPNAATVNVNHLLAGLENEDRVLMMFPIVDSENHFSAGGLGCAAYCHANLKDDIPPQNHTGLDVAAMHTNMEGDSADIWHWKSSRSAPSGYADDKHLAYATGSGNGRKSDSGTSSYFSNPLRSGHPQYIDVASGWDYSGDALASEHAVEFTGSPLPEISDEMPSTISRAADGSRSDVEARASFDGSHWTVEFRRLRDTGHEDDRQFQSGNDAKPPMATAVASTNATTGQDLYNDHCQGCHAANAAGMVINNAWIFPRIQRASGSLIHKALQTVKAMQGISLSEQEIEDIATYLQTQASFESTHKLSVAVSGAGGLGGAVSKPAGIDCPGRCAFQFIAGSDVSLIANYVHGYSFEGWSGVCAGNGECVVNLGADTELSATYVENTTTYQLTVEDNGHGTVKIAQQGISCGPGCTELTAGNVISLTAEPALGYQFDGWTDLGCSGSGPCVFEINASVTVSANFSLIPNPSCENKGVKFDNDGSNGYGLQLMVNPGILTSATDIAFFPDASGDFLVSSQDGTLYYFAGACTPSDSLNLNSKGIDIVDGGEQGLLNVEFDPDFANNAQVYFYHTSVDSSTNSISRTNLVINQGKMVLTGAQRIIDFTKNITATNHDGGGLVFDGQGNLLASVGDGGSGGGKNGQTTNNLLGVVVRITPVADGYTIPDGNMFPNTNPRCDGFATRTDSCPEILAMGLRNPFRMSIDRGANKDRDIIYLGDVGSSSYEEVNSFDSATVGPVNFGWDDYEGFILDPDYTSKPGYRNPIVFFDRAATQFCAEDPVGCSGNVNNRASVILGDVYHGSQYNKELNDKLLFSDYYFGFMRAVGVDSSGGTTDTGIHVIHHERITSMVEGLDGYIYITTLYSPAMVYRLVKP